MLTGLDWACGGHWTLACLRAGYNVNWHDAHSKLHNNILKLNFPGIEFKHRRVDVLMGSPPCIGFSTANTTNRKAEDRQHVLEFALEARKLARAFVMEMVPRFLKYPEFEEFLQILEGWRVQVLKLNAADYGGAQTRKRLYIVGTNWDARHIKLKKRMFADAYLILWNVNRIGKVYQPKPDEVGPRRALMPENREMRTMRNPCQTITQMSNRMLWHPTENRLLGYGELAALMGFPPEFKLPINHTRAAQLIGPGVDIRATTEILKQLRPTLRSRTIIRPKPLKHLKRFLEKRALKDVRRYGSHDEW